MENKNHTHIIHHVCAPELSLPHIHTVVTSLNSYLHTYTYKTRGNIHLVMTAIVATMGLQNTSPAEQACVYAK